MTPSVIQQPSQSPALLLGEHKDVADLLTFRRRQDNRLLRLVALLLHLAIFGFRVAEHRAVGWIFNECDETLNRTRSGSVGG